MSPLNAPKLALAFTTPRGAHSVDRLKKQICESAGSAQRVKGVTKGIDEPTMKISKSEKWRTATGSKHRNPCVNRASRQAIDRKNRGRQDVSLHVCIFARDSTILSRKEKWTSRAALRRKETSRIGQRPVTALLELLSCFRPAIQYHRKDEASAAPVRRVLQVRVADRSMHRASESR